MQQERTVAELINSNRKLVTALASASVEDAATRMTEFGIGCLLVVDSSGRMLGVLSERDLVTRYLACREPGQPVEIGAIMTSDVTTCSADMTVHDAERLMLHRRIRHLPVMRRGCPIGILSIRDVLADSLRSYKDLANSQSVLLNQLEHSHPGISQIRRDAQGRVVI